MGAKGRPFYRLVVADSRARRDGPFIEEVGYYDPVADPAIVEIKKDRVEEWIRKGAIPSPTVRSLLRKAGISVGKS